MDLIKQYGELAFNLDFYTDVLDLSYLVETLDNDRFLAKFKKLNKKICDVVNDYSLLSFLPLNIQKKKSVTLCLYYVIFMFSIFTKTFIFLLFLSKKKNGVIVKQKKKTFSF